MQPLSPLHLLISLHRHLLRSKAHRSIHLLFRPITKTSWSTGVISKTPNTSSPALTKYIPTLGHQREQPFQLLRAIQHSTSTSSTTRRLLLRRRYQVNGSACIQRRTMVSAGSSTGGNQITTALNGNHLFTPRQPILGAQLLPPPPPSSFRSYNNNTKSPWNLHQQQHFVTPYSSTNNDDDNDNFDINTRFYRINRRHTLTNPSSTTAMSTDHDDNGQLGKKQQPYRPPDIRGIADLMENNDDQGSNTRTRNDTGSGNKVYRPGLVRRGQQSRRASPQQSQQTTFTSITPKKTFPSPVDVLRHDDLSLQTTKKIISNDVAAPSGATSTDDMCLQQQQQQHQQWYLSIPMDLTSPSYDSNTAPSSTSQYSIYMENAVSILDPAWLTFFDSWDRLIREHLTKVMILIQLVGIEAQRYSTKRQFGGLGTTTTSTNMDFNMMLKKSDTCTELHICLPYEFLAPLPTTRSSIQHWVDHLMKDPPCYEIKCHTPTNNMGALSTMEDNPTTLDIPASKDALYVNRMDTAQTDNYNDDDDLVMVPSTMAETDHLSANNNTHDGHPWRIDPHYFQGIHTFLNHVDSMIDSSPAFTTSSSQR